LIGLFVLTAIEDEGIIKEDTWDISTIKESLQ